MSIDLWSGEFAKIADAISLAGKYGLDVIPVGTAAERCPDRNSLFTKPDFHFNHGEGEYLQALVWQAALFGTDVTKLAYRPKSLSEEKAALMRRCAMAAGRGGKAPEN